MTLLGTIMIVILMMLNHSVGQTSLLRIVLCRGVQLHSKWQKLPCYDAVTLQGDTAFHLTHVTEANIAGGCNSLSMGCSVLTFAAHFTKRLQPFSLPLMLSTHEVSAWQMC